MSDEENHQGYVAYDTDNGEGIGHAYDQGPMRVPTFDPSSDSRGRSSVSHDGLSPLWVHSITDLDKFFTQAYWYFEGKGYLCLLMEKSLSLIKLAFLISLSVFLIAWVDWGELLLCGKTDSDMTCGQRALRSPNSGFSFIGSVFFVVFLVYWMYCAYKFVIDLNWMKEQKFFFTEILLIPDHVLQTAKWDHVVQQMILANERIRFCRVSEQITAHDIAMRILREDNYLIALFNQQVLQPHLKIPLLGERAVLTHTLEYCLKGCITAPMFDKDRNLSASFLNGPHELQRSFRLWALGHLVLSPFIMMYLIVVRFFFGEVAHLYYNPKEVGNRDWSSLAKWKFKEYNELKHVFQERIVLSRKPADAYVAQFPSTVASIFSKFVCGVLGATVSTMLFVGLLDDSLLMQTYVFERNLLWYIGVFAAVIAVARSFRVEAVPLHDPELCLRQVALHTHYLPHSWRENASTSKVFEEFVSLYKYRFVVFFEELVSVLITPYVLWFVMPQEAHKIVTFINDFTVRVQGIGPVCSLAVFNLEQHGNSKYGAPVTAAKAMRSKHGKLEKSYMNFISQHPSWSGTETGRKFKDNVMQFEGQMLAASVLEAPSVLRSRQDHTASSAIFPGGGHSRQPPHLGALGGGGAGVGVGVGGGAGGGNVHAGYPGVGGGGGPGTAGYGGGAVGSFGPGAGAGGLGGGDLGASTMFLAAPFQPQHHIGMLDSFYDKSRQNYP